MQLIQSRLELHARNEMLPMTLMANRFLEIKDYAYKGVVHKIWVNNETLHSRGNSAGS